MAFLKSLLPFAYFGAIPPLGRPAANEPPCITSELLIDFKEDSCSSDYSEDEPPRGRHPSSRPLIDVLNSRGICDCCWSSSLHGRENCPEPQRTLFESEELRMQMGVPLTDLWRDMLEFYGYEVDMEKVEEFGVKMKQETKKEPMNVLHEDMLETTFTTSPNSPVADENGNYLQSLHFQGWEELSIGAQDTNGHAPQHPLWQQPDPLSTRAPPGGGVLLSPERSASDGEESYYTSVSSCRSILDEPIPPEEAFRLRPAISGTFGNPVPLIDIIEYDSDDWGDSPSCSSWTETFEESLGHLSQPLIPTVMWRKEGSSPLGTHARTTRQGNQGIDEHGTSVAQPAFDTRNFSTEQFNQIHLVIKENLRHQQQQHDRELGGLYAKFAAEYSDIAQRLAKAEWKIENILHPIFKMQREADVSCDGDAAPEEKMCFGRSFMESRNGKRGRNPRQAHELQEI